MVEVKPGSLEFYCRQCDIVFPARDKLDQHFKLYHEQLPHDGTLPHHGTLTSYLSEDPPQQSSEYQEHDFAIQNLQCPSKCSLCNQIIWEVAVWCPACKIRCHRSCSDRVTPNCIKLSPKAPRKPKDHPGAAKHLTDLLRRKVGENKMRYVDEKYDLDFSYISPRIIAMSLPAQGVESVYRNKLNDVADLLEKKHKDKYLIINVSDRTYDISLFKNQVLEFGWPDHHAPLMNTLCCIVKTMDSWLRQDPDHVIVCHCKGGKGRTGVAIAAYIQFNNKCLTPEEALDKFAVKRFYDESTGGVTQPSQRRMVHYFSAVSKNEVQLENRQLVLNTLILFGCPQMDSKRGAKVCFCIYEGFKLIHTTSVYGVTPDREHVYISLHDLKVQSDVMIKAFHITKTGKSCILRVQFHTAFVKNDFSMVFRKKDIDMACRDDRFPDDGVLQLIFKPRASVVTATTDSDAHQALITDQTEAKEVEEMSKDIHLMSFEYADFSSFFTDNPISEMKQNEKLDSILTLHDDYKLITPLLPFADDSSTDCHGAMPNKTSNEHSSLTKKSSDPPPLPPKGKTKDLSPKSKEVVAPKDSLPRSKEAAGPKAPALPPRKPRPPPLPAIMMPANPGYLVEDKDDYLAFEVATPVSDLVTHFEREDELSNFANWVKFDEEEEEPLIDLSSPPVVMRKKSATLESMTKQRLVPTRSGPALTDRKHVTLERKTKSLDSKSMNAVCVGGKGGRSSMYVPYLQRKESVKKDEHGKKRYIPYKVRTDSLGNSRSSSDSSSPAFLSPPPLPPRGDMVAPGPSNATTDPDNDASDHVRPARLPSLSKSMDNLPEMGRQTSNNKVPLALESPENENPESIEYSLKNWEKAHMKKIIKQTKKIWYRPDISRQESQATLVSQCSGAFIIRRSQTLAGSYGLTIRLEDGKKHDDFNLHPGSHKVSNFLIQKKESGKLFINGYGTVEFASLEELVEYFTGHTGGLPHPLRVPMQPYADRIDTVVPMLLRNVSFPVFLLEKRCIRYLPLDSFAEDNVKSLLTETISQLDLPDVRLISMSVTKHGITLTDPDCVLFDVYSVPYKQIRNCEVGSREQTVLLPDTYNNKTANTFGLIHRDRDGEIIYVALAEYHDTGLSITKMINKFRSYLV